MAFPGQSTNSVDIPQTIQDFSPNLDLYPISSRPKEVLYFIFPTEGVLLFSKLIGNRV